MQLKILGNRGGVSAGNYTTATLIDDVIALDAGTGMHTLSLEELVRIEDIIISHTHLDHVVMICFWIDAHAVNGTQATIHCSQETADVIRKFMLNDLIWPDMENIIINGKRTVQFNIVEPYKKFSVKGREFTPLPVMHGIPTNSYCLHGDKENFVFCVDMIGAEDKFWQYLATLDNFHRMTIEISFPDELEKLAEISYHLTPKAVNQLIEENKIPPHVSVLYNHVKLKYLDAITEQTKTMPHSARVRPLDASDVIDI